MAGSMSLTKPIPKKMREELSEDPFMQKCCLYGYSMGCVGKVQWHHHLKFAGKRINEKWCILPVCEYHHEKEARFKYELDTVMVSRATYEELKPFSKAIDYIALKRKYENKN